ncbi:GyrI-like domain-containing protein [Aquabacter sp. L1I39]|uniref:GyrI-like domain-containing protein n=1 Tax=Aquabacter sp. L1I39 TaxID=2820278 RepID=UPI001ADAA934|nr:GyrI-like domain-containing protein [Aquabacter sp. L1I39]QTL04178.1 GyrI-like domain-containing protein [Aquabacter sp. L1I39]
MRPGVLGAVLALGANAGFAQNAPSPAEVAPLPGAPPALGAPLSPRTVPPAAPAQQPPAAQDLMSPEEVVLSPVPVLGKTGQASWENGFEIIVGSLKAISAELDRLGLKRDGDVMVLYTSSDDAGFEFEAQIPFSGTTQDKPKDGMTLGASFSGKVLKFTHHGSFADMDETYESIANYLDNKNLQAQDAYVEKYLTDPMTTTPDALDVDIFVPLK